MKKVFSYVLYALSLIPLIIYIGISISKVYISEEGRLILLLSSSTLMYFGGLLLSKYEDNNKPMKRNLWIYFFLYLILVITLTLFDTSWGRSGIKLKNIDNIKNIKQYINLKPFKTITGYIKCLDSVYTSKQVILNLFGNILAFMPMSIFMPLLFKKQNKWYIFLFTMLFMVTSIELLQFVTGSGRCDIDDLILNVGGAFLFYILIKIKCVNAFVRNILLLEKNKVSKLIILVFAGLIGAFYMGATKIYSYSEYLHNKRIEDRNNRLYYNLKIVDSRPNCKGDKTKFYEDLAYEYYFECNKKNDITIYINDKKFTLDEVLASDFNYDITMIRLKNNGLNFIQKNKYEFIDLISEHSKDYDQVYVTTETNNDLLETIITDPGHINGKYTSRIHLKPKGEGIVELNIIFSNDDKILDTYKYLIIIDNELNVKFNLINND